MKRLHTAAWWRKATEKKHTHERAIEMIKAGVRDADTARQCGYSRERIRQLRNQLGLPSYLDKLRAISKDLERVHRTGNYTDGEIASKYKVSISLVRRVRFKLGLATSGRRKLNKRRGAVRHLLGKMFDKEVARKVGVSINTVIRWRHNLGIQPKRRRASKAERARTEKLLRSGKHSDSQVAKVLKRSEGWVVQFRHALRLPSFQSRWRERMRERVEPLLGKKSDNSIAMKYGLSPSTVNRWRRDRSIPAYNTPAASMR
ncbi:MAG: hypothetical protein ACREJQ_06825 [bacterium]